jgi:hypothetical protein
MAMMRVPDWPSAAATTDIDRLAVVDEALTFARVRFKFPIGTRFPALPVRGLVYPMNGTSWTTGAELVVALGMGAEIVVEAGWRIDWVSGSPRPFEALTQRIGDIRARATAEGNTLLNLLVKEIGNSGYGKLAQAVRLLRSLHDGGIDGVRSKRMFDARHGTMADLPPSKITNPMLAAYVTGIVRATLAECLAGSPTDAFVASGTTDGILASIPVEELPINGPVAQAFAASRARISPTKPAMWEGKHAVGRVYVTKTRGTFSVDHTDGEPILARGGYRFDKRPEDPWEECRMWARLCRERTYDTKLLRKTLTPLSVLWLEETDLVEVQCLVRFNADYDLKRRPIDPRDVEGLICFGTAPWGSIEQFNEARDALEAWAKSKRRVLKTTKDWEDYREWRGISMRQKIVGSTAQSSLPPLVRSFMRAMTRGNLTTEMIWPYERIASLVLETGYPCALTDLTNAKRRGVLGTIRELTDEERAFAAHIHRAHEDINLAKLAAPGSPAAVALRRQLVCHHCGASFQSFRATARYCGQTCRQVARRTMKREACNV